MNPRRLILAVPVILGLLAVGVAIFCCRNDSLDPSKVSLRFTGNIKWIDRQTGMADGRMGVQFVIKNNTDAPLCVAAMAANASNIFAFNSVGFGLTPHSEEQFEILSPTSSIAWRVVVRCREATHVDPDKDTRSRIWTGLKNAFGGERYFFDKRGKTNFFLISRDF